MSNPNKVPVGGNAVDKWVAVILTDVIAGIFAYISIYLIGDYGFPVFVLTPVFIGFCSVTVYGNRRHLVKKEAVKIGFLALGIFILGLLVFAIEGIICVIMASPIIALFTWIGARLGYSFINKKPGNAPTAILIIAIIIPLTAFIEKDSEPPLTAITTSIEINASPQIVWKNVVEFPQLDEPTEFIFKTGIAYPINAKIDGTGVGAIRHCNFTTGSFVEPITVWDEPHLLKFDVTEQPAPMKELSLWEVNPPHLHGYFISKEGQFKLTELPNGNTLLEGTTWYHHNIKPAFYWQLWSDFIVHKIHERVLQHIKVNAEKGA